MLLCTSKYFCFSFFFFIRQVVSNTSEKLVSYLLVSRINIESEFVIRIVQYMSVKYIKYIGQPRMTVYEILSLSRYL